MPRFQSERGGTGGTVMAPVAQLWHWCLNLDIKPLKMVAPVPQLWHRCPNLNTKMLKIVAPVPQLWHRCLNLDISAIIYPEKLTWHRCHQHRYRCHHAGTGAVHWASNVSWSVGPSVSFVKNLHPWKNPFIIWRYFIHLWRNPSMNLR